LIPASREGKAILRRKKRRPVQAKFRKGNKLYLLLGRFTGDPRAGVLAPKPISHT